MSKTENGGRKNLPDLSYSQKSTSLTEFLAAEHFLFQSGLITATAGDNLLSYAYAQPGVRHATIHIPNEEEKQISQITFEISLEKKFGARYAKLRELWDKPGLFNKLRLLWLLKKGIPSPGQLEKIIQFHAKNYVPAGIQVIVNVTNWS